MSCFKKDSFRMLTASASSSASAMESANGLEGLAYLVCLYMGSTQRLGRRVLGDKLVRDDAAPFVDGTHGATPRAKYRHLRRGDCTRSLTRGSARAHRRDARSALNCRASPRSTRRNREPRHTLAALPTCRNRGILQPLAETDGLSIADHRPASLANCSSTLDKPPHRRFLAPSAASVLASPIARLRRLTLTSTSNSGFLPCSNSAIAASLELSRS